MSTFNVQYFLTLFDEFKNVPTPKLNAFVGIATTRVDADTWGANADYARALLTAHMLAKSGGIGGSGGASGGALTQESVGDLSRSFATVGVPGSGDQELLTTAYGQQFVELRRESFPTGLVTGPTTSLPPQSGCPVC